MIIKKGDIEEIIDSNGNLIGSDSIPKNGSDLESQAHGTTDQNAKIGQQPFRYDMLGRFGFSMMPFMEGKISQEQSELLEDLDGLVADIHKDMLKYYYKNPNKLKSDYRKSVDDDLDISVDDKYSKEIVKIVEKHLGKSIKEPETIDESKVVEDKMMDKKSESEITKRNDDNGVKDKRIEKIAGLINKLGKKDVNKLINLLETE